MESGNFFTVLCAPFVLIAFMLIIFTSGCTHHSFTTAREISACEVACRSSVMQSYKHCKCFKPNFASTDKDL